MHVHHCINSRGFSHYGCIWDGLQKEPCNSWISGHFISQAYGQHVHGRCQGLHAIRTDGCGVEEWPTSRSNKGVSPSLNLKVMLRSPLPSIEIFLPRAISNNSRWRRQSNVWAADGVTWPVVVLSPTQPSFRTPTLSSSVRPPPSSLLNLPRRTSYDSFRLFFLESILYVVRHHRRLMETRTRLHCVPRHRTHKKSGLDIGQAHVRRANTCRIWSRPQAVEVFGVGYRNEWVASFWASLHKPLTARTGFWLYFVSCALARLGSELLCEIMDTVHMIPRKRNTRGPLCNGIWIWHGL